MNFECNVNETCFALVGSRGGAAAGAAFAVRLLPDAPVLPTFNSIPGGKSQVPINPSFVQLVHDVIMSYTCDRVIGKDVNNKKCTRGIAWMRHNVIVRTELIRICYRCDSQPARALLPRNGRMRGVRFNHDRLVVLVIVGRKQNYVSRARKL